MASGFYDVIVAGAGPAGLHAAYHCERLGLSALILEEHKQIGRPNHCSGLISANINSIIPKKELQSSGCVEHKVRGAVMHSPNGRQLRLKKPGTAAYVIDRSSFDSFLASRINSEIRLKSPIDAFTVLDDRVMVKSGSHTYESSILLGCDGANSFVRRRMQVKPKELLNGIIGITNAERKDNDSKGDYVEIWYDKHACDGFLWKIPRGIATEYGMLGTAAKFEHLKKFFNISCKMEKRGGLIPLGPPKTYFNRVLLVGDAAAMIKTWSGGGVIYSLTAAEIAANIIDQAKSANDFSENFLKKYEQSWKSSFGGRIKAGMLGRSLFRRMNNTQLNLAMRGMNRARFLMNKLDMDFLLKM